MYIQLAPDRDSAPGDYSQQLALGNMIDANTPHRIWYKITMPSVPDTVNKTDLSLRITCREYAII